MSELFVLEHFSSISQMPTTIKKIQFSDIFQNLLFFIFIYFLYFYIFPTFFVFCILVFFMFL